MYKNLTITIYENGKVTFVGPYNRDLVKEMHRSYRSDRCHWDAIDKTWTMERSQYTTDQTTDDSMIQFMAEHGAQIVRK